MNFSEPLILFGGFSDLASEKSFIKLSIVFSTFSPILAKRVLFVLASAKGLEVGAQHYVSANSYENVRTVL